jgi:hypothetical protein
LASLPSFLRGYLIYAVSCISFYINLLATDTQGIVFPVIKEDFIN